MNGVFIIINLMFSALNAYMYFANGSSISLFASGFCLAGALSIALFWS